MKIKFSSFTPQENLISILPSILAGIFLLSATIITNLIYFPPQSLYIRNFAIAFGVAGSLYLAFYYILFTRSVNKSKFSWTNVIISMAALSTLAFLIPNEIDHLLYTLIFIAALATSLVSTRGPAYTLVVGVSTFHVISRLNSQIQQYEWIIYIGHVIASLMAIETIQQLKKIARVQINKLEIINELSKQIVSTLDTKQMYTLLNAAFQNALEADLLFHRGCGRG